MIFLLYNLALYPVFLLLLPALLWRMVRRGGYRQHFFERFGRYSTSVRNELSRVPRIWLNASSVGEVGVALSLIETWRTRDPGVFFVLSVSTTTGRKIARDTLSPKDIVIYAPFDFLGCVRRALHAIQPSRYVMIESELWANLLRGCFKRNIPVSMVNARVSDRSFPRMKNLHGLTSKLLPNIHPILAQSDIDAERFIAMGANPNHVQVMGSVKFDLPAVSDERRHMAQSTLTKAGFPNDALILMGGSTWEGEEEVLIAAFVALRAEFPALRLLLAPRHAERASRIIALLRAVNLPFATRSGPTENAHNPLVFLLNSTGELTAFYALAHVVFVGKSLYNTGGQNFIEPAALGKIVVVGPHLENFTRIAEEFAKERAFVQINDPSELLNALRAALKGEYLDTAERATALIQRRAGAIKRSLNLLLTLPHPSSSPSLTAQETSCTPSTLL